MVLAGECPSKSNPAQSLFVERSFESVMLNPSTTTAVIPRRHCHLIAGAVLACLAGGVSAQESPYYLGVTQTFTHDSNIGRTLKGTERSDTISSTGLRAGVDQGIGPHRLNLTAETALNRYAAVKQLNNTSYALTGRFDWVTIENISGLVSFESRQSLNNLNMTAAQAATLPRNLRRVDTYNVHAQKGGVTYLTIDGGVSGSRIKNSESYMQAGDLNQTTLDAGVRIQPSPLTSIRVGGRHTTGDYGILGDSISRSDIDLTGTYEVSGLSSVNARISRTKEDHSLSSSRSISATTGAIGVNWRPTGKLSFDAQLARDTNLGSYNLTSQIFNTSLRASDAQIRDSIYLRSTWELSGFISLNATLGYARRSLDNTYDVTGLGAKDQTKSVAFGATYTPLRNLVFGCGLQWEDRSVDNPSATTATYAYQDTSVNCYGQVYLR